MYDTSSGCLPLPPRLRRCRTFCPWAGRSLQGCHAAQAAKGGPGEQAILFGHKYIVDIIDSIEELRRKAGLGPKPLPPADTSAAS